MTTMSAPGDTRIVVAEGVTQRNASNVPEDVTSGLEATYTLLDWNTSAVIDGPTAIVLNADNDWFISVPMPSEVGHYLIKVVATRNGAQQTFYGEHFVKENTPT